MVGGGRISWVNWDPRESEREGSGGGGRISWGNWDPRESEREGSGGGRGGRMTRKRVSLCREYNNTSGIGSLGLGTGAK